jgi:hypothetical protein
MKTFEIDGFKIQTQDAHEHMSCAFCIFDGEDSCEMPHNFALVLGTLCQKEDIIYKDVTRNEKTNSSKTLFDKEESK